jgi:DNA-binding protein HU-beta
VNKAQLIEALSDRLGDKKAAGAAVDGLVDVIVRTVNKGEKVNITGFGVFEKRARAARTARNPRTGETVRVKKTNVPAFRAGTTFKDVVSGAKKLPKVATSRSRTATTTRAAAARPTASRTTTTTRTRAAAAKPATRATAAKSTTRSTAAKTTAKKATPAKATRSTAAKTTAKSTTAKKATPAKRTTAAKAPAKATAKATAKARPAAKKTTARSTRKK